LAHLSEGTTSFSNQVRAEFHCCLLREDFQSPGLAPDCLKRNQSIIRGGHTFLTVRTAPEKVTNMGDRVDLLIPLNQDAIDRHLNLLTDGAACVYNSDTIKPGVAVKGGSVLPASRLQTG
jgi:2-oxoglutarate/2-oxoacid ferredoxin oxidoreductase subunit alpha